MKSSDHLEVAASMPPSEDCGNSGVGGGGGNGDGASSHGVDDGSLQGSRALRLAAAQEQPESLCLHLALVHVACFLQVDHDCERVEMESPALGAISFLQSRKLNYCAMKSNAESESYRRARSV